MFKCSRFQADMALSMDRNGNGLLYEQYCYADATHKRCPGFKTLTLWVYLPLLRKLVKLATMESSREDTEGFVQFWSLLNEVCLYIAVFLIRNVQTDVAKVSFSVKNRPFSFPFHMRLRKERAKQS